MQPNSLPNDELVTFEDMLAALVKAPQFVHVTDDNLRADLETMYDEDFCRDYSHFSKHHSKLKQAWKQGYLSNRVYDPREVLQDLIDLYGAKCLLCFDESRRTKLVHIAFDNEPVFENQLSIDDSYFHAPDIYCPACRHSMNNPHSWYVKGFKKDEAFLAQMSQLLNTKEFRKRASKAKTGHHKFEIPRPNFVQEAMN